MNLRSGFIIALTLVICFSCRTGEDDPLLSLKSRNSRITGSWKLVKMESKQSILTNTLENNDVNENTTQSSITEVQSKKFSEDFLEEKIKRFGRLENISYAWIIEADDTLAQAQTTVVEPDVERNLEYNYEFRLEIKKDDSYRIIKTSNLTREYFVDATKTDGISNPVVQDSIYSSSPSIEIVEEGFWYWREAHKDKAILVAGEIQGYVNELRDKRMVITDFRSQEENNKEELSFRNDLELFNEVSDYGKRGSGTVKKESDQSNSSEFRWEFEKID